MKEECTPELSSIVEGELKKANENQENVTPILERIDKETDGIYMIGKEYMVKTEKSLKEKIESLCIHRDNLEKAFERPLLWDVLRYTFILPYDNFKEKLFEINSKIRGDDISVEWESNSYCDGNIYKGINNNYSYNGYLFEIQFHTQESFALKQEIHGEYEEFRLSIDPVKRCKLYTSMLEKSRKIANIIPPCKSSPHNVDHCTPMKCNVHESPCPSVKGGGSRKRTKRKIKYSGGNPFEWEGRARGVVRRRNKRKKSKKSRVKRNRTNRNRTNRNRTNRSKRSRRGRRRRR